jgi:hypothetical protein
MIEILISHWSVKIQQFTFGSWFRFQKRLRQHQLFTLIAILFFPIGVIRFRLIREKARDQSLGQFMDSQK